MRNILNSLSSPFGLPIAVVLIFGGADLFNQLVKLENDFLNIKNPMQLHSWMNKMHTAEVELLRVDWRATAPVVFCNEFSIGWNAKSKNCSGS